MLFQPLLDVTHYTQIGTFIKAVTLISRRLAWYEQNGYRFQIRQQEAVITATWCSKASAEAVHSNRKQQIISTILVDWMSAAVTKSLKIGEEFKREREKVK